MLNFEGPFFKHDFLVLNSLFLVQYSMKARCSKADGLHLQ